MSSASSDDRGGASVIVCAVVMPALATVAIGLRVYVRVGLLRTFKSEDWLIVFAWVCRTVVVPASLTFGASSKLTSSPPARPSPLSRQRS